MKNTSSGGRYSSPIDWLRAARASAHFGFEETMMAELREYFKLKGVPESPTLIRKMLDIYRDTGLIGKIEQDLKYVKNNPNPEDRLFFANKAISEMVEYYTLIR